MFQVNLEYLESKLECLDGDEVQQIQDNINSLFHHCVQAMGEEHQIKVVNALQVCPAEDCPRWVLLCLFHWMHFSYTRDPCNRKDPGLKELAWLFQRLVMKSNLVISDGQCPV